jgi:hypothetical protein
MTSSIRHAETRQRSDSGYFKDAPTTDWDAVKRLKQKCHQRLSFWRSGPFPAENNLRCTGKPLNASERPALPAAAQ